MSPELEDLLRRARTAVDTMTPAQKAEMLRRQAESVARAEASWPKAKYRWVDGTKVYDSYEDYLND